VSFRVGEIEPLYCSLSLYWVDYKVERQHSVTVNLANSGRISESFNFEVRKAPCMWFWSHLGGCRVVIPGDLIRGNIDPQGS
jgi:hypothetical protein